MAKMGRPKKLKVDRKMAIITVRVTTTEKRTLEDAAKAEKMQLATWVRRVLMEAVA